MRYWVLSPNIGMSRGTILERWKEIILEHDAVFMGWRPERRKEGSRSLGQKFAKDVRPGDVILSAYRHNWQWTMVACGRVKEEKARNDLNFGDIYSYGTYRLLKPFVPLEPDPKSSGLSLKKTSPDKLRQIPAIVELKPDENRTDRRVCDRLRAIIGGAGTSSSEPALDLSDEEVLKSLPKKNYEERRRRFVLHRRLESVRNRQLVSDAKTYFKMTHSGKLTCEVCNANFEKEYGARGRDFIEAHHRVPIAKIKKKTKLRISDLAMVCANCHRMLHRLRPRWVSVKELRSLWRKLNRK